MLTDTTVPQASIDPHPATWQIQRAGDKFEFQMSLDRGDLTERAILDSHNSGILYEQDVATLMINVLRPDDVALDVGANVGFFTTLAATLVGRNGHVLAFEPAATCADRLRRNVDLNQLTNVTVIEQIAMAYACETDFYLNSDNSGGNALWDPGEFPGNEKSRANPIRISAPATTVDEQWTKLGLPIPKLIKIDTEGAEQRVLEGAIKLIADCKVPFIVAELHEFGLQKMGCTQQSLRRFIEGFGYSTFGLYYSNSLPKLIPPASQIRSPFIVNLLFSTVDNIAEYWPFASIDPRSPC